MVTPTNRPTDRQGEYRAICLFEGWKIEGRYLQYPMKYIFSIDLWILSFILSWTHSLTFPNFIVGCHKGKHSAKSWSCDSSLNSLNMKICFANVQKLNRLWLFLNWIWKCEKAVLQMRGNWIGWIWTPIPAAAKLEPRSWQKLETFAKLQQKSWRHRIGKREICQFWDDRSTGGGIRGYFTIPEEESEAQSWEKTCPTGGFVGIK